MSALMSAAMVNLGIYGIVRVGDGLLGGGPAWWWLLVMTLGALSALFGSLHSATSSDLKRLLAYSTTDNVGLMLLGVGASGLFASTGHRALALLALVAALLHVVFHAVFKGSLFLVGQLAPTGHRHQGPRPARRTPAAHAGDAAPSSWSAAWPSAALPAALRLRQRMAPAPGHAARASLLRSCHRGGHAHRGRRARPHRRADRPDLRQGRRHRAARASLGAKRRPKRTRSAAR